MARHSMKKVVFISTMRIQFHHFQERIAERFLEDGFDVLIVTGKPQTEDILPADNVFRMAEVDIERDISPVKDFLALCRLLVVYIKERPDIVISISAKAGFLSALASWVLQIEDRIHVFAGIPWFGKKGLRRELPKLCDKIVCRLSTVLLSDSRSQAEALCQEGVVNRNDIAVIVNGSVQGFPCVTDEVIQDFRKKTRHALGLENHDFVLLYCGRICREKGIIELAEIYQRILERLPSVKLLIVGYVDHPELEVQQAFDRLVESPGVIDMGYQKRPLECMAATNLVLVPSYREGFCNVVIESASVGVPAVGFDVVGLRDSIDNGVSGTLVDFGDLQGFCNSIVDLHDNKSLLYGYGQNAKYRAREKFDQERVLDFYRNLINP